MEISGPKGMYSRKGKKKGKCASFTFLPKDLCLFETESAGADVNTWQSGYFENVFYFH